MTKLPAAAIPTIAYDISSTALANNKIQFGGNSLDVQFPAYTSTTDDVFELKFLARAVGIINIPTFLPATFHTVSATHKFYFFKNLNFVIAERISTSTPNLIQFGAAELSNQFSDEYGFEWLKVHSALNS